METITVEENFNSDPAGLWRLWTTREGLCSFFGADAMVELRLGGPFEIYFLMDNEYGLRGSEGCRILSFLPGKMLSFSWNAPPAFPGVRNSDYSTWVVILFSDNGDGTTGVSLHHTGWPPDEKWRPVHEYFEEVWPGVFAELRKSFQPG